MSIHIFYFHKFAKIEQSLNILDHLKSHLEVFVDRCVQATATGLPTSAKKSVQSTTLGSEPFWGFRWSRATCVASSDSRKELYLNDVK